MRAPVSVANTPNPTPTAPGGVRFGVLSTYPPTACGLATFSAALARGLRANGADVGIVRIADESGPSPDDVIGELLNGSPRSVAAAARTLNGSDVAIVQHEYGLYGGRDGDEVVDILGHLEIPSIVVAHTVLQRPTTNQRAVLERVAAAADQLVVMTEGARDRLLEGFDVDPGKVVIVPHGAVVPPATSRIDPTSRPRLLTWGLIGPGKGIERVIDAMRSLQTLRPRPQYLVAGQTHPKVRLADGEVYRNSLIGRARANGVAGSVAFDDSYRDVASLNELVRTATVVVLPYDSKDQVTSGVLVDAIAAGRPVVATAFPHAIELLRTGAGLVVDHDDPDALEAALYRVLSEPAVAAGMAAEAARLAPAMSWHVVAASYLSMAGMLLAERPALV